MNTINYYNQHSKEFYERTINVEVFDICDKFLELLPSKANILDAGCGVGRDSKYFLKKGNIVTAFDASVEMVNHSTKELQQPTLHLSFQDMNFNEEFDGVWVCASLLHVPYVQTKKVYQNIYESLKPNGIFYGSYKHGDEHMSVEGRDFYNMTETSISSYFSELFEVIEIWQQLYIISKVVLSPSKSWLNFLVRKI